MKCPVCDENMQTQPCSCGYDRSLDYEQFPTFGGLNTVPDTVSRLREARRALVRCAGCGYHGFTLSAADGKLACMRCARTLTEEELKPLTDALGMKKAEPKRNILEAVLDRENMERTLASLGEPTESELEEAVEMLAQPEDPKRIVAIAAGLRHTVALYADGTVRAVGEKDRAACNTEKWENIKAISAGWSYTVGLKTDGTVVYAGSSAFGLHKVGTWKDITAISAGTFHVLGLKKDGTVVAVGDTAKGKCKTEGWREVVEIAAGDDHSVGLTKKGTVLTAGKGKGTKLPAGTGQGNRHIAAGCNHTALLNREGLVLIAGNGGTQINLGTRNSAVEGGVGFTLVLKKNGTAAASGMNHRGQCNVGSWKDLAAVAAGWYHSVGLKKDGTLVATGDNKAGQCDVHKLMRE